MYKSILGQEIGEIGRESLLLIGTIGDVHLYYKPGLAYSWIYAGDQDIEFPRELSGTKLFVAYVRSWHGDVENFSGFVSDIENWNHDSPKITEIIDTQKYVAEDDMVYMVRCEREASFMGSEYLICCIYTNRIKAIEEFDKVCKYFSKKWHAREIELKAVKSNKYKEIAENGIVIKVREYPFK